MRKLFTGTPAALVISCLILPLAFVCITAKAQKAIPELWGQRVHDEAKILPTASLDRLEKELKVYEDSTSNQIAILIVSSLNGEPIEDYSIRVADKWKLGTKKNDNGVLIVIAVDDHAMRIEVGKGLEPVLTDAISSRIIRDEMAPNFRRGDYDAGIEAAVTAIAKAIAGEYKSTGVSPEGKSTSLLETIVTGFFIFGLLAVFTYSSLLSTGCAGWGVYVFLIPFYAIFPWVVIGKIAAIVLFGIYVIGYPITKIIIGRTAWGKAAIKDFAKNTPTSGGRSSGGFLGGAGGFLSGGGGGGFFGGGGGFGGGGASGSW